MDELERTVEQLEVEQARTPAQAQLIWALTRRLAWGPPLNEFDLTIALHLERLTGLAPHHQETP